MEPEKTVAYIALAWLVGATLFLARSIRRGRDLASALAERHPDEYEALGRPQPGYFESARRTRFARFVMRREYEKLGDTELRARFEEYRAAELRLLVVVLTTMVLIALLMLAVRFDGL